MCAIDVVEITPEIGWRFVTWEGFNQLSSRPLCRGMLGYVKVHHPSAVVDQDRSTNRALCIAVGTVKKSRDTRSYTGFFRRSSMLGTMASSDMILLHPRFGHVKAKFASLAEHA